MEPFREWTVLPHGTLTRLDENLVSVTGLLKTPGMGDVERRMTVVRLSDGRLIVFSAICLDEAEMSALERFGTPAYLIVPNRFHRMDAKVWKDRYPTIKVIAPAGARPKVEKVVHVDATEVDFGDPHVRFRAVPGTGESEVALEIETDGGTTLVLNDLIFNLRNRGGLRGWLFKKLGMTNDGPHVPAVVRMRQVDDKKALRDQLERWSRLPNLKRIIIAHGNIITSDAAQVLSRVAGEVAA